MSYNAREEVKDFLYEIYPPISCIYALVDPQNGDIRYIGETKDAAKRLYGHMYSSNSIHIKKWVDDLNKDSLFPRMFIVEITTNLDEREKFWISHYLSEGADLLNDCAYTKRIRGYAIGYNRKSTYGIGSIPNYGIELNKSSKTATKIAPSILSISLTNQRC